MDVRILGEELEIFFIIWQRLTNQKPVRLILLRNAVTRTRKFTTPPRILTSIIDFLSIDRCHTNELQNEDFQKREVSVVSPFGGVPMVNFWELLGIFQKNFSNSQWFLFPKVPKSSQKFTIPKTNFETYLLIGLENMILTVLPILNIISLVLSWFSINFVLIWCIQ